MCLIPYQAHSLFYLLSPCNRVLLEKRRVPRLLKIFLAPYGNRGHRSTILISITNQINRSAHFQANYLRIVLILLSTSRSAKWSSNPDISSQITTVRYKLTVRVICRVRACKAHCCVRCVSRGEASETPTKVTFATFYTCLARSPLLNYRTHLIALMPFHGRFQ